MRQIVLDTETTGLEPSQGHRIIEIGCVEVIERRLTGRHFHQYINPGRAVDEGAMEVHGITDEFLVDKPAYSQISQEFFDFVKGAQLVIHNAPFDIGFLNHESKLLGAKGYGDLTDHCSIVDTLVMAREKHPGQRNSLDALCKRYGVDNSQRELHGALLDAEILADVYLLMTGGQTALSLSRGQAEDDNANGGVSSIQRLSIDRAPLIVIAANEEELTEHEKKLAAIDKKSEGNCIWLK